MQDQSWSDWLDPQSIRIAAPQDRVWRAWADPDYLSHWYPDEATGAIAPGETVILKFTKFGFEAPYLVRDLKRGKFLALETQGPGGLILRTDVALQPDENHTLVTLSNLAVGDVSTAGLVLEDCASGWQLALAILKQYTESYFGRTRTNYFAIKRGAFDMAALPPFFASDEHLARWLTTSGAIGGEGEKVSLVLQNGEPLTGKVLARSDREVALSWDGIDGVIELKAFEQGADDIALCLRASSWRKENPPRVFDLQAMMADSLERLAATLDAKS